MPRCTPFRKREDSADRLERAHHELLDDARRLLDLLDRVREQQVEPSRLERRQVGDLGGRAAHAREVLERRRDVLVEPLLQLVHAPREAQPEHHEADHEARLDDGSERDHAEKDDPPGLHGALHLFLLVTVGLSAGLDRRSEAVAPLLERLTLAVQVAGRVLGGLASPLERFLPARRPRSVVSRSFSPSSSRVSRPERGAKRMASAAPDSAPTMKERTIPDVPPLRSSALMSTSRLQQLSPAVLATARCFPAHPSSGCAACAALQSRIRSVALATSAR